MVSLNQLVRTLISYGFNFLGLLLTRCVHAESECNYYSLRFLHGNCTRYWEGGQWRNRTTLVKTTTISVCCLRENVTDGLRNNISKMLFLLQINVILMKQKKCNWLKSLWHTFNLRAIINYSKALASKNTNQCVQ